MTYLRELVIRQSTGIFQRDRLDSKIYEFVTQKNDLDLNKMDLNKIDLNRREKIIDELEKLYATGAELLNLMCIIHINI